MVGVLGSNPSVDTKQISKSLKINNWEIFLFLFWHRFGVIKDESSTATDKNEEKEWYPQTLP